METVIPAILSGGSGTRLWPVSRAKRPKQLLALLTDRTLLHETALRVQGTHDAQLAFAPPIVIGNVVQMPEAKRILSAAGISPQAYVSEPIGRNTAPAACLIALLVKEQSPGGIVLLVPADHHITDAAGFRAAILRALPEARAGRIVTFGIIPTGPQTGYGYICRGAESGLAPGVFQVARFAEKPDRKTAESYLAAGTYSWNAGIFLARADVLLDELQRHAPKIVEGCTEVLRDADRKGGDIVLSAKRFEVVPAISLDYAVMEKTERASVVPVDMGWSDIGSWDTIFDLAKKDGAGNAASGDVVLADSTGNLVRAESRLVALIGVKDLVVIETADAVLIVPKSRAQEVGPLVQELKKRGRSEI